MRSLVCRLVVAVVAVAWAACDDGLMIQFDIDGPLVFDASVAYLDRATSSLIVVDPNKGAGKQGRRYVVRLSAGDSPARAYATVRPDDPSRSQLVVTDPGADQALVFRDKKGTSDALDLGVPLEAMDVSADGRYGVVYQPEGVTPSQSMFAVQNTVAVLDLHPDSPTATLIRLGASGVRPVRAVFSASMRLEDTRTGGNGPTTVVADAALALVFVRGGLIPIDLEQTTASKLVPLTADRTATVLPSEVLFTNNRGDVLRGAHDNVERAFVRTTQGQLFVLSISIAPGSRDLLVALENVVTPDAFVRDVDLFFDADGNALLLAAAGDELILVDGYTGVASRFASETFVDSLARFDDPATGAGLALGYARDAAKAPVLLRIDPLALDRRRSTGVESIHLANPLSRVEIAPGTARALLRYSDGRNLGVLDLTRDGELVDLRFAQAPSALAMDDTGERLWLVSQSPGDDAPHLAEMKLGVDLDNRDVRLDEAGTTVGSCGDFVWVDHNDAHGAVTFFPRDQLDRSAGIAMHGVFYTGLFSIDPELGQVPHAD